MQNSILLLSSSVVHGYGFLEYSRDVITSFMSGISTPLVFVPFAAGETEWDSYTDKVRTFFTTLGIEVKGIHTLSEEEIWNHEAIFIGGGNTFRLLNELQERNLLPGIRNAVLAGKMRYMGSSAGTNMATKSICTTNDMPIVYPRGGYDALNLFTYQVNPHYLDPEPGSTHKGETRDQRLAEFHQENDTPVIGLREGAYISIAPDFADTHELFIGGAPGAKIFLKGREPYEAPGETLFRLEA